MSASTGDGKGDVGIIVGGERAEVRPPCRVTHGNDLVSLAQGVEAFDGPGRQADDA
ncbi:MAG: hypothetical protein RBT67_11685 [Thauera sp.]|jgi:hypothetical protein|nr:hypothetical protein [Thauera sp.]